jgi:hypothetical protein
MILELDSIFFRDVISRNQIKVNVNYALIDIDRDPGVKIQHVYPEANSTVDWLVNFCLSMNLTDKDI